MSKSLNDNNLTGNKQFWFYIKSKRNDQCGILTLVKGNKAYTNYIDHFSSVFKLDNSSVDQMPPLDSSPPPEIPTLHIDAEGIKPLLNNLNAYKLHSPDSIATGNI